MRYRMSTSIKALWKMLVTARPSLSVISLKFALRVSKASVTPSLVKGCTKLVSKLAEKLGRIIQVLQPTLRCDTDNHRESDLGGQRGIRATTKGCRIVTIHSMTNLGRVRWVNR